MNFLPVIAALFVVTCFNALHASESVSLAALGDASPLKFAESEMALGLEGDALIAEAPSFWKCGWQIARPKLPVFNSDSEKPLVILVKGSSANESLVLKLRFVSSDWKRADIYEIPLSGLNADEFVEFAATTSFGTPTEQENGGLAGDETMGALQFLFKGKGNAPVNLAFQAIQFP